MLKTKGSISLTGEDRELLVRALKAGKDYYVAADGPRAKLSDDDIDDMLCEIYILNHISDDILQVICFGLEKLWWIEGDKNPAIPEMLSGFEGICGYEKTGGVPPKKIPTKRRI